MHSKKIAAAQFVIMVISICALISDAFGIACFGVVLVYLIGALEY